MEQQDRKDEDKNKILIAVLVVLLLLLIAIIFFLFFFKWPKVAAPVPVINQEQAEKNPLVISEEIATSVKQLEIKVIPDNSAPNKIEVEKINLEKIASLFTERLGSYSNQSDYGNILDLKIMMTDSMKEWADGYIAKAKNNSNYDGIYRGTITHAVIAEVEDFTENSNSVKAVVNTQRVESSGDTNSENVYYEDLAITFVKENNVWLVDFAKWQGKK